MFIRHPGRIGPSGDIVGVALLIRLTMTWAVLSAQRGALYTADGMVFWKGCIAEKCWEHFPHRRYV